MNLLRVEASDGRVITLTYSGAKLASATDGTRTYSYSYDGYGNLARVQLPDGSAWAFNLLPMVYFNMPVTSRLNPATRSRHIQAT